MIKPKEDLKTGLKTRNLALRTYNEFLKQHGLSDGTLSSAIYQVYQDLRLVRGWTNLEVVFSKKGRPFLCGFAAIGFDSVYPKRGEEDSDRTQAVVPVPTKESLTPKILHNMGSEFRHPRTQEPLRCVTLAIVDEDTTTAYYRIFNDFKEILHPQWKQKRDEKCQSSDDEDEEGRAARDSETD